MDILEEDIREYLMESGENSDEDLLDGYQGGFS